MLVDNSLPNVVNTGFYLVLSPEVKIPVRTGTQMVFKNSATNDGLAGWVKVLLYPNHTLSVLFYAEAHDYHNDPNLVKGFYEITDDELLKFFHTGELDTFEVVGYVRV